MLLTATKQPDLEGTKQRSQLSSWLKPLPCTMPGRAIHTDQWFSTWGHLPPLLREHLVTFGDNFVCHHWVGWSWPLGGRDQGGCQTSYNAQAIVITLSGSFKFAILWAVPFPSTYALCFLCEVSFTCQSGVSQSLVSALCFRLSFLWLTVARAKLIISTFNVL